jgi:hypothetical protein
MRLYIDSDRHIYKEEFISDVPEIILAFARNLDAQ